VIECDNFQSVTYLADTVKFVQTENLQSGARIWDIISYRYQFIPCCVHIPQFSIPCQQGW